MKKTLITLLALAGVGMGEDTLLWTMEDINIGTKQWIDLTSEGISSASDASGFTVVLTMSNWKTGNGPVGWFSTETYDSATNPAYGKSAATFGYGATNQGTLPHATTLSLGGSAGNQGTSTDGLSTGAATNTYGHTITATTLFMTVNNGAVSLYDINAEDPTSVVEVAKSTGMTAAAITGLYIGHWNGGNPTNAGTMDVEIYSGVQNTDWMNAKLIPEPTTATLSLLALAGLAARRRRK